MFLSTEKKVTPFGILGGVWPFGRDEKKVRKGREGEHGDVCLFG